MNKFALDTAARVYEIFKDKDILIAGGFARDLYYGKDFKDVDVIMAWPDEVPRASPTTATVEEMERLAYWCISRYCLVRTDPYSDGWYFVRVCPNYHENSIAGSFDDRIGCVVKLKVLVEGTFVSVDILIPKNVDKAIDYVEEFDYNINQFVVHRDLSIAYHGGDSLQIDNKVREVGSYGRKPRLAKLKAKFPELDFSEATTSDGVPTV